MSRNAYIAARHTPGHDWQRMLAFALLTAHERPKLNVVVSPAPLGRRAVAEVAVQSGVPVFYFRPSSSKLTVRRLDHELSAAYRQTIPGWDPEVYSDELVSLIRNHRLAKPDVLVIDAWSFNGQAFHRWAGHFHDEQIPAVLIASYSTTRNLGRCLRRAGGWSEWFCTRVYWAIELTTGRCYGQEPRPVWAERKCERLPVGQ